MHDDMTGWAMNVIFRVEGLMDDAPGVFALRIKAYGQESTELIEGEMQWLAAIRRDMDLAVPEPVAAQDGALVQEVEVAQVPGGKQCVLYRWVEGVQKGVDELQPLDMQRVGTFMARLHDHAAAFAPDHEASPRRKMNWRWQVGNWAKGRRETELPYTKDELQLLARRARCFSSAYSPLTSAATLV